MRLPRFATVLAVASVPVLAGGAIAVAHSVSTQPGPQVIIPARTSSESPTTTAGHRRADDAARHDAKDDHGRDGAGPAGHDVNDDHGRGADDPAGHDVGDDHGHDGTVTTGTTATTATTAPTVTTVPDDRGDDGPGHDVGDDHGHDGSGHDGSGDSGH